MIDKLLKTFKSLWNLICLHKRAEISWSYPRKAKILVLDACGLDILTPLFGTESYEIIFTRGEKLYITPGILWNTLINLALTRHPFIAYIITLMKYIQPSIVVTYIDNSGYFVKVSQIYKGTRFLAIQNGMRCLDRDYIHDSNSNNVIEFACFGKYEVDMYSKHKVNINQFYPIGSLRDSYYRNYVASKAIDFKYDLCLVSEVEEALPQMYPEIEAALKKLTTYLVRFCDKTGKTLAIAARNNPNINKSAFLYELQWYKKQMGEQINFIHNDRKNYSTYSLIDSSLVSISFYSTALLEAFGRGKRSLFCNFSNKNLYSFPKKGIWAIEDCSYEEFEDRLINLLAMSDEDFKMRSTQEVKYFINYDETEPTHVFLRHLLSKAVNK